jgi:hypothetical protein
MSDYDYRKDLWAWFGLTYASWLTLPRVLMHEMPDDWQQLMAVLLHEWDEHWDFSAMETDGSRVQLTKNGRIAKTPEWLKNYRHPRRDVIAQYVADKAEGDD